ncbi:MAG: hypothetical protein ACRDFZ_02925 [Candidatus Limnocylindria bacterium]
MSRAERRQYQRMMKGQDPRGLPPRAGGRRPQRPPVSQKPRDWSFHRGFWLRSIGIAVVAGLIGLSVAWPSGAETALLAGLGVGAATIGLLVILRLFLRRASTR